MAEVYLAVAQGPAGFNKLTVIKQIRPQLAEDPEFLAMFLDEARLAARLNHPNVVQTNEVGHDGNQYFIAMEYLEGQPLNRILHRIGRERFPLAAHLRVLADALAGLHCAHDLTDYDGTPLEVVHRDVTPHNVFLTYDGQAKVVDFGIAKAMSSSSETRTGVLKGKVAYMAPEQARGERVDRRADIFSMGVMLWEAATGKRLWAGLPDVAILARIVGGELPSPRSVRPDIAPELEAIILRAMAYQREHRHRTAGELQADIERLLDRMGERVVLRDVGRMVAQHFEEERAKIRSLVEAQLRDARSLPTNEYRAMSLPVIAAVSSSLTPPALEGHPSSPDYGSWPSARQGGSLTVATTARSATPPPRPRTAVVAALAVAGVAGLAAGIWLAARAGTTDAGAAAGVGAAAAPSAAPATSAPTPAAPASEMELRVTVKPAEARITLDDTELTGNPASRRAPRDGSKHRLRVEAPGYLPATRELSFEKDFDIELSLDRDPAAEQAASPPTVARGGAAARPAAPAAAPTQARTEEEEEEEPDMKRGGAKPVRPLDTTNPFTNP